MWLRWVISNLLSEVAEKKVRGAVEQVRSQMQVSRADSPDRAAQAETPACDIVAVFALGLEANALVDRMQGVVATPCASFVERVGVLDGHRLTLAESGVGAVAARQATEDVIALHHPAWIISAGFAGALHESSRRGHIVMADQIVDQHHHALTVPLHIDPRVVAANRTLHVGRLLSVDHVVLKADEKRRLAAAHQAIACDMETMAVAKVCQEHGVRFLSVRVISDLLDESLPVEIEHLIGQHTIAAKLGAATRAVFHRPGSVKDLWKLRELAGRCSEKLAQFLAGVILQLRAEADAVRNHALHRDESAKGGRQR